MRATLVPARDSYLLGSTRSRSGSGEGGEGGGHEDHCCARQSFPPLGDTLSLKGKQELGSVMSNESHLRNRLRQFHLCLN